MRRIRLLLRDDQGVALPIVVGLAMVMVIMVAAGMTTALSGLRQAATSEDRSAAYDAAYAGVQDYLVRINADAAYGQYGNSLATFSAGSTFPSGTGSNPAFGINASGTWAAVPTASSAVGTCAGPAVPCFRYSVDNRRLASSAQLRLQSTGRVGNLTRTLVVNIKRRGFVNYLWYTDYEVQDPALSGNSNCAAYAWASPTTRPNPDTCRVSFTGTDVLAGPVHSNDTIAANCGTTFKRAVTTADPRKPNYYLPTACSPSPFAGVGPTSVSKIEMPATNRAMKNQTRSDLVATPGCLYTGPTVVRYNADSTMTVWSPWTKFTNTTATAGSNPTDRCGTPGSDAGQLGAIGGATVAQLDMNLLYVQTLPTASSDPNYSKTTDIPKYMTCYDASGTKEVKDAAASVGWKFDTWAFPMSGEGAPDGWDDRGASSTWNPSKWDLAQPAYGCKNGDLYVLGRVETQTTAASDDYVYIVGDLKYDDKTQDVLGLVGDNAVLVWNPVNAYGNALLSSDKDREVDAALLSVGHTFQVQNFNHGTPRGTLTVLGSISQKFRGPVSTFALDTGVIQTGYRKDYQYQDLLESVTPPYFLAPTSTNFTTRAYMSAAPAWKATGAP